MSSHIPIIFMCEPISIEYSKIIIETINEMQFILLKSYKKRRSSINNLANNYTQKFLLFPREVTYFHHSFI